MWKTANPEYISKKVEVNTKILFVIHNCLKSDRKMSYNKIILFKKNKWSVL